MADAKIFNVNTFIETDSQSGSQQIIPLNTFIEMNPKSVPHWIISLKHNNEAANITQSVTPHDELNVPRVIIDLKKYTYDGICEITAKTNHNTLKQIIDGLFDLDINICMEFVTEYVKKENRDLADEICLDIIKKNWSVLQYIKEQTIEMCLIAIKENIDALNFISFSPVKFYKKIMKLAYKIHGDKVLNYVCFEMIKLEDIVKSIRITDNNKISNKVLFRDVINDKFVVIAKLDDTFIDCILKHIYAGESEIKKYKDCNNFIGKIMLNNLMTAFKGQETNGEIIKNILERNLTKDDVLKDTNILGFFLIKKKNKYELYEKKVELITKGWIISHLERKASIALIGEYYDCETFEYFDQ
jgi:hypothetical protein